MIRAVATALLAAVASTSLIVAVGPIDRAAAPTAVTRPVAPPYRWPLAGDPSVVVGFDPPAAPWLPGQRGVDLGARAGERVYAAGAGTVVFAGRVAGVGVVSIAHDGGLRTTYEPLRVTVRRGDRVAAGDPIGRVDGTVPSCPAGVAACLHWGLIRGGAYLDPLALLGLAVVRLLPTG